MYVDELARKQEILETLKERLHERELQAAQYGMSADPIIPSEIRKLKAQIRKVEHAIREINGSQLSQVVAATIPPSSTDGDKHTVSDELQTEVIVPPQQQHLGSYTAGIPDDVLTIIRAQAEQSFPADFSTRRYKIDQEIQAWRNLQAFAALDLPGDILAIILDRAAQDFPHDYSTRLYKVKQEVNAWRDLQAFQAADLPTQVLETILNEAAQSFPDNFSTQLFKINNEVNAWRDLSR
jgi:hypothetical protein